MPPAQELLTAESKLLTELTRPGARITEIAESKINKNIKKKYEAVSINSLLL
jgi:hypothetical protein